MKQSVSLITLGVADYARAKAFYEGLGWTATWEAEETAFFQANGVVLVLWGRDKLAKDMGIEDSREGWGGIALAHNVGSREEVDGITAKARTYLAPLIKGEDFPPFRDGLPRYVRLKNTLTPKKLSTTFTP